MRCSYVAAKEGHLSPHPERLATVTPCGNDTLVLSPKLPVACLGGALKSSLTVTPEAIAGSSDNYCVCRYQSELNSDLLLRVRCNC